MTTITIPVGLLLLAAMACVWLLWRLGREEDPPDDDDRLSRAWLEALIRERRQD